MTPEQKKLLAEWMGKRWTWIQPGFFNPDTNPTQFLEVLRKLSPEDKINIDYCVPKIRGNITFDDFIWISDHKPEVIDAILEVITQQE